MSEYDRALHECIFCLKWFRDTRVLTAHEKEVHGIGEDRDYFSKDFDPTNWDDPK